MIDFIELTHMNGDTIHLRPDCIVFFHRQLIPNGEMVTYVRLHLMEPNTILVKDTPDEIAASIYAHNQTQRSNNSGGIDGMVSLLGAFLSNNLPKQDNNEESDED